MSHKYKFEILSELLSFTNGEAPLIFDIGCDGGFKKGTPLHFLQQCCNSSVVGFEPSFNEIQPSFEDWMIKNAGLINTSRSIELPYLITDRNGLVKFNVAKNSQKSSCLKVDTSGIAMYQNFERFVQTDEKIVRSTTVDDVALLIGKNPDIIKIDTQGLDFRVLKGSQSVLQEAKPWIITEMNAMKYYHGQGTIGEVSCLMESYGYTLAQIYPANLYLYRQGTGPNVLSWFDALWIDNSELENSGNFFKKLMLYTAFDIVGMSYVLKKIESLGNKKLNHLCSTYIQQAMGNDAMEFSQYTI